MTQLAHRRGLVGRYDWFDDESFEPFEREDQTWDVHTRASRVEIYAIPDRQDRGAWLRTPEDVEAAFHAHAAEWRAATEVSGLAAPTFMHPAYQRIIGLGPDAVPLIINELRREVDHWFWALTAIVGRDVGSGATTLKQAAQAWIDWYADERL